MKKIAFFVNSFGGGGAEKNIKYLIDELIPYYEIHLIVFDDSYAYKLHPSVHRHLLYDEKKVPDIFKILLIPYWAYKLKLISNKLELNVVISFLIRPNLIASYSKKIGLKPPLIISERVSSYTLYSKSFSGLIVSSLIKRLYKYADIIIPNSLRIKYELEHFFRLKNKMTVIYNPVDIDNILQKSTKGDSLMDNNDNDTFTFINIGRLTDQKNQAFLINAFSKIKETKCRLLIIGEGPDKDKLIGTIKELEIESKVSIYPFQTNPYMFLKKANCFVLTSKYEGFPNVVLEALTCGIPVISTDCSSGPREILSPETDFKVSLKNGMEKAKYGLLVGLDDQEALTKAMLLVLSDSSLMDNYIQKATGRAKEFALKKQTLEFKEVIDKCLFNSIDNNYL